MPKKNNNEIRYGHGSSSSTLRGLMETERERDRDKKKKKKFVKDQNKPKMPLLPLGTDFEKSLTICTRENSWEIYRGVFETASHGNQRADARVT